MLLKYLLTILGFFFLVTIYGQNPISPEGIFIADPSGHVWKDGRLYIYGSLDKSPNYFCSSDYHILSSSNLMNWVVSKNIFSLEEKNNPNKSKQEKILYAPDCGYINGKYCLFYCQPGAEAEGVAEANTPIGPFLNAKKMNIYGHNQIDPSIFTDNDGKNYYIWGQFDLKIAELKPNSTEIDSSTIFNNVITEKEHFFHEGAFLTKKNDTYYLIYAHMGRKDKPTCLGYSTSKSPIGPYQYRGVIIDNEGCDPSNWNNHGSIVEFQNQWYVLYHRATHGSQSMRKACIEPIYFEADGSIKEVEMTSQGAGKPLIATDTIEARRTCMINGNARINSINPSTEVVNGILANDYIVFKYLDFGKGVDSISIKIKTSEKEGGFNLHIDKPWGEWKGYVHFPKSKQKNKFQYIHYKINPIKGVHAIYLKFYGGNNTGFEIDNFIFHQSKNKISMPNND
ncbi:MAG: carbohydrate-binding protein [Cytophagales bacterium]|nr:MAG: carbohydrate-binding protein [Cytophagales bacterium]